jgi:hypothetical protein
MVTNLRGYVSPGHGGQAEHCHRRVRSAANGSGTGGALRLPGQAQHAGPRVTGAAYCAMLAVDITAFNDHTRGEAVQRFLRAAMYDLLTNAFGRSRLTWVACHHEDRGDGVLVIAPPAVPPAALIDPLVDHLRAGLRLHNKLCSDLAKIRLRMSVHAGQVYFDDNGVCGVAVTHLFRMLDAAAFKRVFAMSGADFALVTSDALYGEVLSQGPGLIDPDMYAPINIRCKETRGRVWLFLPPVRNPFLSSLSGKRRPGAPGRAAKGNAAPARPVAPVPLAGSAYGARTYGARTTPFPQRVPLPQEARKDRVPALAGLIAAGAATRSRWLGHVSRSNPVPARLRERLQPHPHPG